MNSETSGSTAKTVDQPSESATGSYTCLYMDVSSYSDERCDRVTPQWRVRGLFYGARSPRSARP
jgi:hypothetical protein